MVNKLSQNILSILRCPQCDSTIEESAEGVTCDSCQTAYRYTDMGSLDLRLQRPREYQLTFTLGETLPRQSTLDIGPTPLNPTPDVDYTDVQLPYHMSRVTLGYFPAAQGPNSLALDLAGGTGLHKEISEHAGFEYVGVDLDSSKAPIILGDAHSLPFKDNSFEFVISIAAFEHIRFPFVAMQEAYRVLKPGGRFLGTVAFQWPFHGDSFYHCTHLGTINLLEFAGFKIEDISASKRSVITAHARGLFPRMPQILVSSLVFPLLMLHKAWYQVGSLITTGKRHSKEIVRLRDHTSGFAFIAIKE